jgi:transposase
MSLYPEPIQPVPEETARVARAAFPRGNLYLQLRDLLGSIYSDEDSPTCSHDAASRLRRPGAWPW